MRGRIVRPPSGSVGGGFGFSLAAVAAEPPRCRGEEPVMRVHAPAAPKMTASETNDASAIRRWRIARSRDDLALDPPRVAAVGLQPFFEI